MPASCGWLSPIAIQGAREQNAKRANDMTLMSGSKGGLRTWSNFAVVKYPCFLAKGATCCTSEDLPKPAAPQMAMISDLPFFFSFWASAEYWAPGFGQNGCLLSVAAPYQGRSLESIDDPELRL
ncbi:hypothetical protein KC330_g106 [Hortaea werneckii]|nr:hypothetical protein KC330_g106 [Hortaea werneckii]